MSIIEKECIEVVNKIDFEELKNKKVLITGASGLIGVYLISCLKELKNSHNIEIFAWIKNNVDEEFSDIFKDCNIIKGDITEDDIFLKLPTFDYILHSSGYGQPGKFLEDKVKTILINTNATINLFNKLDKNGKFLFVSTSELYSGLDIENITEEQIGTTGTDHPRSCYIEGKRCGESICHSFIERGYNVKIVRLSLAYGPGTKRNDHRVLNSLIQKGLTQDKIRLFDRGDAVRTYCYITDVIEMFWNILFFGKQTTYNVGGKDIVTILDLANFIGKELRKEVVIPDISNELNGTPKIVNVSIKKYTQEFNKKNFTSLSDGLKNTINWQKNYMKKISYKDFEKILGFEIDSETKKQIKNFDLTYRKLTKKERDEYILNFINVLTNDVTKSGKHRLNEWESGWEENLNLFKTSSDINDLIPKYHGKNRIVRWMGEPVLPITENFDYKIHICFVDAIVKNYLKSFKNIYEFGCGPAYHLLRLKQSNSNLNLFGTDWTGASQEIIDEINKKFDYDIKGLKFDFFNPNSEIDINSECGIYTVAALEQVGEKFDTFINFLLEKKPGLCVHLEPIDELLDDGKLIDSLSIKYFRKRNYLKGFLPYLENLEKNNKIEILKKQRIYSGSYFIEGHSLIVWKIK
jgi:nucleoside-diphosphate-sugar epimerase